MAKKKTKKEVEKPYEQYIRWDNETLIELSDILIDNREVIVIGDDHHDYIDPIETNNTLADIIKTVQKYFNKVEEGYRSSCFYIEGIKVLWKSENKILLSIQYGT